MFDKNRPWISLHILFEKSRFRVVSMKLLKRGAYEKIGATHRIIARVQTISHSDGDSWTNWGTTRPLLLEPRWLYFSFFHRYHLLTSPFFSPSYSSRDSDPGSHSSPPPPVRFVHLIFIASRLRSALSSLVDSRRFFFPRCTYRIRCIPTYIGQGISGLVILIAWGFFSVFWGRWDVLAELNPFITTKKKIGGTNDLHLMWDKFCNKEPQKTYSSGSFHPNMYCRTLPCCLC